MSEGLFDSILNATEAREQTRLAMGDDWKSEIEVARQQLEVAVREIKAGIARKNYHSGPPIHLGEMAYNVLSDKNFSFVEMTIHGDEIATYIITWGR